MDLTSNFTESVLNTEELEVEHDSCSSKEHEISYRIKQFAKHFLVGSALSFRGPKRMLFQEVLVTANSCRLGSGWEDGDFQ